MLNKPEIKINFKSEHLWIYLNNIITNYTNQVLQGAF